MVSTIGVDAQVTTYFNGNYVESKLDKAHYKARLYSVALYRNRTEVTIELMATKKQKRMGYWVGSNVYVEVGGKKFPFLGASSTNGELHSCYYNDGWGWNNVKKGEKRYYTLVFAGRPPEGVTSFSLIDQSTGAHGFSFRGYTLNNPETGEYISYISKDDFEEHIKNKTIYENDPICGIYEQVGGEGYRLAMYKDSAGYYGLLYIDDKNHMSWWNVAEVKATLEPSATLGAFKAKWLTANKQRLNEDCFITCDGATMSVFFLDGSESKYIKMFPNSSVSIASTNPPSSSESSTQTTNQPLIWTGTAWALLDNYIVTNYHVVDGAKSIAIKGVNGDFVNSYSATIIATDKFNDLAVLRLNDSGVINSSAIPYMVSTSNADVGEEVFVLGYPLTATMGDEIKLTTGVISSRTGFQGDVSIYQISAPIQPGNSGGPLFDSKGNVIGVVVAKHNGAENVSYAIKTSYLKNLIESGLSENVLPETNQYSEGNLSAKVKAAKPFVYYIICSDSESSDLTITSPVGKVYSNPKFDSSADSKLRITSVEITPNNTIMTFRTHNDNQYQYAWVTMDKNAYIVANGQRYTLTKAEGIAISPNKTYYTKDNTECVFRLYFPAIPTNTQTIDFIENAESTWQITGIHLQ